MNFINAITSNQQLTNEIFKVLSTFQIPDISPLVKGSSSSWADLFNNKAKEIETVAPSKVHDDESALKKGGKS